MFPPRSGCSTATRGSGARKCARRSSICCSALARLEGIVLDPVYTAKAFGGLLDFLNRYPGRLGRRVCFIHTGGDLQCLSVSRFAQPSRRRLISGRLRSPMPELSLRGGEVDGLSLHYVVEGRGPAVILLHGLGGFAESWRGTIDRLASRATVFALDLPGFGRSAKPRSRTASTYFARARARLHRRHGHRARPRWWATPWAAAVAVTYALTHPLAGRAARPRRRAWSRVQLPARRGAIG